MSHRPHNAVFYCADVTNWISQEYVYVLAHKHFERTVDIIIIVAGILDSSGLINDTERGKSPCEINVENK